LTTDHHISIITSARVTRAI